MTTRQKILLVIDNFENPHAGTEGQLYQLVEALDRRLFEPELLVFRQSEWLIKNVFPCPVRVLGSGRIASIKTWWRIWCVAREFRQRGFQLAHVFFNDPSLICPPVFKLCGIKTLISRRDMGYWYTPIYKFALKLNRYFVSGVVTNSRAVAEVTCAVEGYRSEQAHVIYNGFVKKPLLVPSSEHPLALRRESGRVLAGLVANIRPIKRMQDAVTALAMIAEQCPQLDLVIIGAGDQSALRSQAEQLGVSDKLYMLGGRDDVQTCLQCLDIALLCSESEGFSNALIEYQMAALPVIASKVGGNLEAIEHGVTGLLYDCADVNELARLLQSLVTDESKRLLLGRQAQQQAGCRYSVNTMIAAQEQLYRLVGE